MQAWPQGSVIPRVYDAFLRIPPVAEPLQAKPDVQDEMDSDQYALELIEAINQDYRHLNYGQLAELTRMQGTPWDLVYRSRGNRATIDPELIKEYYLYLAEDTDDSDLMQLLEAAN